MTPAILFVGCNDGENFKTTFVRFHFDVVAASPDIEDACFLGFVVDFVESVVAGIEDACVLEVVGDFVETAVAASPDIEDVFFCKLFLIF